VEEYDKKNFHFIFDLLSDLKGESYSLNVIEKIIEEIDNIALLEQYEFIDADISETIFSSNKLDFEITIKETKKDYVERIDIFGNSNTYEEVIRDQLLVDEGDGYNKILHNKSIANLKALGFFGEVNSEIIDGTANNKKIIKIEVEERPTGEITAGAGVGTSGSSIGFGVKENNFLGKGISLNTNISISDDSIKGLFSYSNPNFKYSDKSLVTSFGAEEKDKLDKYGYKSSLTHFNIGTRFEQYRDIYFSPNFKVQIENIETSSSASSLLKKQEGNYFDSLFVYGITMDKRNQSFSTDRRVY
jgi:Outer membrane protein/protective antigen OMA87